jgi:hypothetical protein
MNTKVLPGANVSIVFYVDGKPVAVTGEVKATEPFTVWTNAEGASHLAEGRRAMLVVQTGRDFSKAEAELHSTQWDSGWEVVANSFGWEAVDRRRYPRYDLHVPIFIRAVTEEEGNPTLTYIEGHTEDVSIGGAWVKTSQTLPSASLVEVTTALTPDVSIRALSLVKWADREHNGLGFGVEFLDFLDGSRYTLHQFLSKQAA